MLFDLNTPVLSDNHWYHKNILKYEPKRIKKMKEEGYNTHNKYILEEHTKWLINMWNSQVQKNQKVLNLGDLTFKSIEKVFNELNGEKYLILGNHDKKNAKIYKKFEKVYHSIEFNNGGISFQFQDETDPLLSGLIQDIGGVRILFSHYPVFDTKKYINERPLQLKRVEILEEAYTMFECQLNIHGHSHSRKSDFKNAYNVSIDATDYEIKTIGKILEECRIKGIIK